MLHLLPNIYASLLYYLYIYASLPSLAQLGKEVLCLFYINLYSFFLSVLPDTPHLPSLLYYLPHCTIYSIGLSWLLSSLEIVFGLSSWMLVVFIIIYMLLPFLPLYIYCCGVAVDPTRKVVPLYIYASPPPQYICFPTILPLYICFTSFPSATREGSALPVLY